ncbi:putative amidoligase domain-containing protein [Bacillus massilinigeriensis]|uniref:putative amidoligase domain-containing protein n=1 Tax=Bacillus massilionigeriensis TaxID=1805475 RepID=UPI00096AFE37|nr:YheC/YheD family protein [Bacillus massilionigeriensis]
MESFKDQFWIPEDKELTLQMLKINNIKVIEVVDAKTSTYPIIGRRFGNHEGKDITIVHSKEQAYEEGFDFFTKLYSFEKEYRMEIKGLFVINAEESVQEKVMKMELPIRIKENWWKWKEIGIDDLPEEWLELAVRTAYVTGTSHAMVKIGIIENDIPVVIDINPLQEEKSLSKTTIHPSFTIGTDVEFMLSCDDSLLPASDFFPVEGSIGCDERQIEQDSGEYALAEIRPEPSSSPYELFCHIKELLVKASLSVPYQNISFQAGSMPFFGYQCGGHIHFGVPPSVALIRALDYYLAIPFALIEESSTSRRRRGTKHGGLGRIREKPYGFEYLSLSSWLIEPKITLATLCLAKLIIKEHLNLQTPHLFHPLIQRAYYQGNRHVLYSLWEEIKESILSTESYQQFENEISYLINFIEEKNTLIGSTDIRISWGLPVQKELYERGLIIHVPKKIRTKFNLTEGEDTFICAGKSIAKATIRPHPFSFRNSNILQISPMLRKKLAIPNDWNPKIASANGAIILGPIMGILADRPFERQATYFQHLSKIAKDKQMLVYVFEPNDILWDQQLIKGTTLNGEGLFPFPAVIYDRYFRSKQKRDKEMDELRAKLQFVYQIPFINTPTLFELTGNKWASHQLLIHDHEEFLPDTRLLEQPSDLEDMLNLHGEIFVKPVGGALSNGIYRIMQNADGIYWMNLEKRDYQRFSAKEELFSKFFPLKKNKLYLVQEAIKRKKLNGNYVELRCYMQKNGRQKWVRTGMVARLSSEGVMSADTEINKRSSHVLSKLYPNPSDFREIRDQIATLTKSVVETIENEIGSFGELAVDVCIDEHDMIKILEINAKPDNLFAQVHAYKLRHLAALRLLNYATSLTGYELDET